MRGLSVGIALATIAAVGAASGQAAVERKSPEAGRVNRQAPKYVPGEVIVRFRTGVGRLGRAEVVQEAGAERKQWLRTPRTELLELPNQTTVKRAVRELEAEPDVLYAEPNWIYRKALTPNDPRFGSLWGLDQPSDADIDAPEAWDETTGSKAITVAVVDTGIAYDHPDLAPNMWVNPADPAGGGDDDHNGFPDDVRGWDFVQKDNDPRDLDGHGTHVSGTIGARGNNGLGVTGVNLNVSLMAVRVLGADGSGTAAGVANGFDYAGDMGVKVVNASLGAGGESKTIGESINRHPKTLFVVAAGNNGVNNDGEAPMYPCNHASANLICVAATNEADELTDWSNYGAKSVDVAAPGTEIFSSWPGYETVFSDGFETDGTWIAGGRPSSWARTQETSLSGSWSATDSPGVRYENKAENWFRTTNPIDLSGRYGCNVSYALKHQLDFGYDYLEVAGSTEPTEPTSWINVGVHTGETPDYPANWSWSEDDLSTFNDESNFYLRFGFESDESFGAEGAHVDNVTLRCFGTTYGADAYRPLEGTSMATPHVTGAAALVWARNPQATLAAVRAALLTTVDRIPALRGKLATGGRLNAARAVHEAFAPPPPPPRPAPKPVKKVTICFHKRTIKIPKSQLAKYRKKGAKLGRCAKPRKQRR